MAVPYKIGLDKKTTFLKGVEENLSHFAFPPQIIVETTAACNLTCTHCGHSTMTRTKGHMKEELWKKIIDEIALENPATEIWPTFYGEALILKNRIAPWIKYAVKEKGLTNTVLNTNGMLLHDSMIEELIDSGLHKLIISMDGFTRETFESIRQGATHDYVYQQGNRLLELKKLRKADHMAVEMQYSMMDENEHEVDDFRKYWLDRGALVKTREKLTWTGTKDAPNLYKEMDRIACPWAVRTCAIHWNGDLVACAVDYDGGYVAGNVKHSTVRDVWNGPHKSFVENHLNHRFEELPDLCKGCIDWQVAGGAYHETPEGEAVK